LGLIAIFIFDGYMGIYDTLSITAGEQEQIIEADTWLRQDKFQFQQTARVDRGEKAFFSYEVDNRRFSSYTADVEVSAWRMQEKVLDVVSQPIAVASFDKGQVEWVIDTTDILPSDIPPEQSYEYTVIIKRGEIERNIILYVNYPYPIKAPIPAR